MVTNTAENHGTTIEQQNSASIHNLSLLCPTGMSLEMFSKEGNNLDFSNLDDITFVCVHCQREYYSVTRGELQVLTSNETLVLFEQNSGYIECAKCPYGAYCDQSVHSERNFWGDISGGKLEVIRCRNKQCCSEEQCSSFPLAPETQLASCVVSVSLDFPEACSKILVFQRTDVSTGGSGCQFWHHCCFIQYLHCSG